MTWGRRALVAAVLLAVGLMAAFQGNGFPASETDLVSSDSLFDWVTTRAAWDGRSPYAPIGHLLTRYTAFAEHPAAWVVHPRGPGALLIQTPLLLVGPDRVLALQTVLIVLSVAGFILIACSIARLPWWSPIPLAVVFFTEPIAHAFTTGSQAPIIAFLLAATWKTLQRGDSAWSGLPAGVAASLKLFPLVLIPLLWARGYRRCALGMGATVAGFTLAGSLLPGVTLADGLKVVSDAGDVFRPHIRNLSVVALLPDWIPALIVPIVGATLLAWWTYQTKPGLNRLLMVGSSAMIVLSPIVWGHYLVVLLPGAIVLLPAGSLIIGALLVVGPDDPIAYLVAVITLAVLVRPVRISGEGAEMPKSNEPIG